MGATCSLIGFDSSTICSVSSKNIYILFRGVSISKLSNYVVQISGLNNPSYSTDSFSNIITTYSDNSNIICQRSYPVPSVKVIPINACEMQIKLDYSTMGQTTNYYISIGCNGVIRENSEIRISMPVELGLNHGDIIECSCDNNILLSNECLVDLNSSPNKLLIIAQANGFGSYSGLVLKLNKIKNPVLPSPYSLTNIEVSFYSYSVLYGNTRNKYSISYSSDTVNLSDGQLYFNRLIFNANEESTYFFTIWKSVQSTKPINTISIQFPDQFIEGLGQSISCGGYLTSKSPFESSMDLIKYKEWKQFVAQGNYENLDCIVDQKEIIIRNAYKYAMNNTQFVNFFIDNIVNPSKSKSSIFNVIYSYNDRVDWVKSLSITIDASALPNIIQISKISLTDYNVRRQAQYTFTIGFPNGNFLNSYNSPLFSLELPQQYAQVLPSQPSFNCFNSFFLNKNKIPTCNLYGREILTEPYPMNAKNKSEFQMIYEKLINPNFKTTCSNQISLSQLYTSFKIKLIDISNNNIIARNYPALDLANCIEFQQNSYVAYLEYNTNMLIGLTYQINIILETPGDGITYVPKITGADTTYISITPDILSFVNYTTTNLSFTISSTYDAKVGEYVIHSNIYETTPIAFFLPILNQNINLVRSSNILSINDVLLQKAIISFDDIQTIGNGADVVIVEVHCSQAPGDTFYLDISYNTSILQIAPSRIILKPSIKTASFSIKAIGSADWQVVNFSLSASTQFISQEDIPFILEETSKNFTLKKFDVNYALEIFGIKKKSLSKNLATFDVYTSKKCKVSYALSYYGSPAPSKTQILENTYSKNVSFGNLFSQPFYHKIVDYIAEVDFSNLEANSQYVLYTIAQDEFNITSITSIEFTTKSLSFSWGIKMHFLENITLAAVLNGLALTLRLPSSRFVLLNDHKVKEAYVPKIMKPRPIIYEILIAPDPFNDETKPRYFAELMSTNTYIKKFKSILSQFNEVKGIFVYEYRLNPPKLKYEPKKMWSKYYEVLISMSTMQRCKIYAIRILDPHPELNSTRITPTSQQIYKGMNQTNDLLNKTPYYVFKGVTDENGYIEISMTDLFDGYTYDIYITAGNNYPYEPQLLFTNSEVQHIRITTPINKSKIIKKTLLEILFF